MASETVFQYVTFPVDTLLQLLFENYNWCYVYHYLKVAQLLPIMLTMRQMDSEGIDVTKKIEEKQAYAKMINRIWLVLCAIIFSIGMFLDFAYTMDDYFLSITAQDAMFSVLGLFLWITFVVSMRKLQRLLR